MEKGSCLDIFMSHYLSMGFLFLIHEQLEDLVASGERKTLIAGLSSINDSVECVVGLGGRGREDKENWETCSH